MSWYNLIGKTSTLSWKLAAPIRTAGGGKEVGKVETDAALAPVCMGALARDTRHLSREHAPFGVLLPTFQTF